jgi:HD-like signal output (HDOD) protein
VLRVKAEIEAHLRSIVNFPSPPGVATHIIELARDPDIEMGKVAKALSMDSALSMKVLRIANSPLYAQRRKSENLRQALVVLGLNATLTLALSFSLVKSLRVGKANGISYPLYWRRALIAATAARALGDAMRQSMAEEIFLAALLQDVGILALDKALPDLYHGHQEIQADHAALAALEKKHLQVDHAEIGGWLMCNWNLPERLNRAIEHSHRVDFNVTNDPIQIFERCVALSGPVADLFLREPQHRHFAEIPLLGLDRPLRRRGIRGGASRHRCGNCTRDLRAHRLYVREHQPRHRFRAHQSDHLHRLRDARHLHHLSRCRRIRESSRPGALHGKAPRPQPQRALRQAASERARTGIPQACAQERLIHEPESSCSPVARRTLSNMPPHAESRRNPIKSSVI